MTPLAEILQKRTAEGGCLRRFSGDGRRYVPTIQGGCATVSSIVCTPGSAAIRPASRACAPSPVPRPGLLRIRIGNAKRTGSELGMVIAVGYL